MFMPSSWVNIVADGSNVSLRQGDRMQAADRMLSRDVSDPIPTGAMITNRGHHIDHHAIGITERQDLLLIAGTRGIAVNPQRLEAFMPPAKRGSRHAERRGGRHAGPLATLRNTRPGKKKVSRLDGLPFYISSGVEMIGVRRVEVDRLLDQAEPERPGVEIHIGLRIGGDGGYVMQPVRADLRHDDQFLSSSGLLPSYACCSR